MAAGGILHFLVVCTGPAVKGAPRELVRRFLPSLAERSRPSGCSPVALIVSCPPLAKANSPVSSRHPVGSSASLNMNTGKADDSQGSQGTWGLPGSSPKEQVLS